MPKITNILFDCDNTLVLSEELAFEACADLANEILESRNIPDRYTGPQLMDEFVGQNFRGMMVSLKAKYKYDMEDAELDKYVTMEEDRVIANLKAKLRPCVGVDEQLERLQKEGKYHLSVVSSSAYRRVKASVEKVNQLRFFREDEIYSAATSLPKPTSKPDPAVYIHAMEKLNAKPEECVAVEDSKSGSTAAFRANIKCVGYVGSYPEHEQKAMAEKLLSCNVHKRIMKEWSEFPAILKEIEES